MASGAAGLDEMGTETTTHIRIALWELQTVE